MSLIQKSEFVVTTECALLLHNQLLWRSWQRVGLIIPRSPVRSWSGADASIAQSGRACA